MKTRKDKLEKKNVKMSKTAMKPEDERAFPPSGRWVGVYIQHQKEYNFNMILTFFESSEYFYGYCHDEENEFGLGFSDIQGRWFRNNGVVHIEFDKHYRDKHDVDYKGEITDNFERIAGEYFGGSDDFVLHYRPENIPKDPVKEVESAMFGHIREYYLSNMEHLFDFEIVCNEAKSVKAHKIIIASQSKFFEGFFRSDKKDQVTLDFESQIVQLCIEFMYTARVNLNDENVQDILEVANYLGVACLVEVCAAYIATNIDICNCIAVAQLSSYIESEILSSTVLKFLVKHFQDLIDNNGGEIYQLPPEVYRQVLQSNKVIIKTKKGNVTPGTYREYHLLDLAHQYVKKNPKVSMSFFLDSIRIPDIVQNLASPHFLDYKEIENKSEIAESCANYDSNVFDQKYRLLGKENIFNYDPRISKVSIESTLTRSEAKNNRTFYLSCENFNQDIKKISLFSQTTNFDGSDELLKKIQLTFCDGSEKSISTEVGTHNKEYSINLGEDIRHILYLTGSWVADPLEHLLGLRFILSDGSMLSFREDQNYNFERKQSVLDFLPENFHAGNIRWIGLTGSILDTSQCGDSVICNLKFRFSALTNFEFQF